MSALARHSAPTTVAFFGAARPVAQGEEALAVTVGASGAIKPAAP
jgi:hypothetical protein